MVSQTAEQARSEMLVCPGCRYDLRGTAANPEDHTLRCPECGVLCKHIMSPDPPLPLWLRSRRPSFMVMLGPGAAMGGSVSLCLTLSAWATRWAEPLMNLGIVMIIVGFALLIVHAVRLSGRYAMRPLHTAVRRRGALRLFAEVLLINILFGWLAGIVLAAALAAIL